MGGMGRARPVRCARYIFYGFSDSFSLAEFPPVGGFEYELKSLSQRDVLYSIDNITTNAVQYRQHNYQCCTV